MSATVRNGSAIASRNPDIPEATARVNPTGTPEAALPDILRRARAAQADWELQPVRARSALVRRLRDVLYQRREALTQCVMRETGKPLVEALFGDLLIALDTTQYYAQNAAPFLRERRVPHHNIAVKAKSGKLHYEPYGVIGIIAPWNYPLAIPLGQVVTAVVGGQRRGAQALGIGAIFRANDRRLFRRGRVPSQPGAGRLRCWPHGRSANCCAAGQNRIYRQCRYGQASRRGLCAPVDS